MLVRSIALITAISFASLPSLAQQAEAPTEAASATQTCAKRHDHGAERQAPTFAKDCKPAPAKVAKADKKKSRIQGHDHGKFHKNQ